MKTVYLSFIFIFCFGCLDLLANNKKVDPVVAESSGDIICEIGQFIGWTAVTLAGGSVDYSAFETLGKVCKTVTGAYEFYKENQEGEFVPFQEEVHIHSISLRKGVNIVFQIFQGSIGLVFEIVNAHATLIDNIQQSIDVANTPGYSFERLYGQDIINGIVYTASVDVKRLRSSAGFNNYVVIENLRIEPELVQENFQADLQLQLVLGGRTFPIQEGIGWRSANNPNFKITRRIPPNAVDIYFNPDTREIPSFMLLTLRTTKFGRFGLHQIGSILLTNEEIAFPPAPPRLSANSLVNTIELNVQSGVSINQIDIYRSDQSDFSIAGLSPIQLVCTNNRCIDQNVQGGTRYYYKAIAKNQAGTSNISNEVSGMPTIQFLFQELDNNEEMIVNTLQTIRGKLYELGGESLGDPISGAEVRARYYNLDWLELPVTTDHNGYFEVEIRAPALSGSNTIVLEGSVGSDRVIQMLPVGIIDKPDKGHNLALHEVILHERSILIGGVLSGTIQIENRGVVPENSVLLEFTVRNQAGDDETDFVLDGLSLGVGQQTAVSFQYVLPESIGEGNYVLFARVKNEDDLDELPFNSQRIADFYVQKDTFSFPVFRTGVYVFNQIGQSFSLAGNSLTLQNISGNEAQFVYKSKLTGFLAGDADEKSFWVSDENDLLLLPIEVNPFDTTVTVRAGGIHDGTLVLPQDAKIKHGDNAIFNILLPSGREIIPGTIQYPFGQDAVFFSQWNASAPNDWISVREYHINLHIPKNQLKRNYKSWIRFDDQDFTYFTQKNIEVKPIHDIGFVGNINITAENEIVDEYGNVMDPVAGLVYSIKGILKNNGEFTEKQQLYFRISNTENFDYAEMQTFHLTPGQQIAFEFEWNTLGLDTGTYAFLITAPNSEDKNSDNTIIGTINIIEPPELDVVIQLLSEPYNLGDVIPIRIFAGRQQEALSDAIVSVQIEHPDGFIEGKSAIYNQGLKLYEVFVRANLGGNYYITATAERSHYKKRTVSSKAQVYVHVTLSEPYGTARLAEYLFIDLSTSPTGDVNAFAADIIYDGQILKLEDLIPTGFLNDDGKVQTSKHFSHQKDKSVLGYTRLGTNQRGATTFQRQIVGSIALKGIAIGNSSVTMENVGIMDSKGQPMAVHFDDLKETTVKKQNAVFQFDQPVKDRVLFKRDTLDIVLTNAYQVQSALGTIQFDPSKLRVLFLTEGDALKTGNNDETLFVTNTDQENGIIEFGVSRIGNDEGLNIGSQRVASIIYEPLSGGSTILQFSNTGIVSANGEIRLPTLGGETEIRISGTTPNAEKATLFIEPNPVFANSERELMVALSVSDAKDVYSFASDISFDPQILEFEGVVEGSFLNENNSVQTSLNYFINADAGILTLGLSRMGSIEGVDTDGNEELVVLKFIQNVNDSTRIELFNTGLIISDGETRIPVNVYSGLVGVFGDSLSTIPHLLRPEIEADLKSREVHFEWESAQFAEFYQLHVSHTEDFVQQVIDTSIVNTQLGLTMNRDSVYYWRVRGVNGYGYGDWSEVRSFLIKTVPEQVELVSPLNDTEDIALEVELVWNGVNDVDFYNIQVATDDQFNDIKIDTSGVADTTLFVSDLEEMTDYFWRIRAENQYGSGVWSDFWKFTTQKVTSAEIETSLPKRTELSNNYPNPFNPTTKIRYALPTNEFVQLEVFNLIGQRITLLVNEHKSAGWHSATFDASSLSSGVYLYRLRAGEFIQTRKLILVK